MTRAPTERSHLSIGEVLSLRQDEFPDVTISKLRFLEAQGLLDPERLASIGPIPGAPSHTPI